MSLIKSKTHEDIHPSFDIVKSHSSKLAWGQKNGYFALQEALQHTIELAVYAIMEPKSRALQVSILKLLRPIVCRTRIDHYYIRSILFSYSYVL